MANVSVSVPPELKKEMDEHDEVNWSAVARNAFERRLQAIEVLEKFASTSTLTEEDTIELGRKVNAAMAERYKLRERKKNLLEKQAD